MKMYVFALLAVLLILSPAYAGLLFLNDNVQDSYIIQDETRYRVLDRSDVFVLFLNNGFTSYSRFIVENADLVDELNETIANMTSSIAELEEQIAELEQEVNSSEELRDDAAVLLESLKERRDSLASELEQTLSRREELENAITGAATFSFTSFWATIIIFIILLLIVIGIKWKEKPQKKSMLETLNNEVMRSSHPEVNKEKPSENEKPDDKKPDNEDGYFHFPPPDEEKKF